MGAVGRVDMANGAFCTGTLIAPHLFAVSNPSAGSKISVVSHARGRADTLSRQRTCQIKARFATVLAFDCDVDHGSSGAPMLDRSNGRANIISIISSGARENGKAISFGMQLPRLVADLKTTLRTGNGVFLAKGGAPPAPKSAGLASHRANGA